MNNVDKMFKAIEILKPNTPLTIHTNIINEETFNTIKWEVDGINTTTNPHAELTWTKVKTEMDKL